MNKILLKYCFCFFEEDISESFKIEIKIIDFILLFAKITYVHKLFNKKKKNRNKLTNIFIDSITRLETII